MAAHPVRSIKTVKALLYGLILRFWVLVPLKRLAIRFLRLLNLSYEKYIRDLWFVGQFDVAFLDTSFRLSSTKLDKGMLEIYYKGLDRSWDAASIVLWGKLARRSQTIFDVGANFGLYALAAKAANPSSTVYAFEPSRFANTMLSTNVVANNFDIKIVEIALSSKNGTAILYDSMKSSASSSLIVDKEQVESGNYDQREVKSQTFVDFVRQEGITKVDLISIDVELFEPDVLEGMGELILLHKPDFIIEVLNNDIGMKIESFFSNMGYFFYEINEREPSVELRGHVLRHDEGRSHSYNFLICSKETAIYLELKTA